jgi:hypothetical protein
MLMILFLLLVLEFLLAASGTFTKFRDASCVSPSDDPVRFTARDTTRENALHTSTAVDEHDVEET